MRPMPTRSSKPFWKKRPPDMAERFTVEPIWPGQNVVIIGGGPSLSLQQINAIGQARLDQTCRVIAVNDAVYVAWWADWLHACDAKWWAWHRNKATRFPGIKTTLCETVPHQWVDGYLEETGETGFEPDPAKIRHGSNGTYQAMHCAIHSGAKKIILVGVDMYGTHWHGGHPDGIETKYTKTMIPKFETLKPALQEHGVSVVNCSPGSALKAFPAGILQSELESMS